MHSAAMREPVAASARHVLQVRQIGQKKLLKVHTPVAAGLA
jgi:hypothetical protein